MTIPEMIWLIVVFIGMIVICVTLCSCRPHSLIDTTREEARGRYGAATLDDLLAMSAENRRDQVRIEQAICDLFGCGDDCEHELASMIAEAVHLGRNWPKLREELNKRK